MKRRLSVVLVILFLTPILVYSLEPEGLIQLDQKSDDPEYISKASSSQLLWFENAGGSGSDNIQGIDVDDFGNVYVCGYYHQTMNLGGLSTPASSSNTADIFVAKLSVTGEWLWVKTAGSTNSDYCYDIDVDKGGNVSITGIYYGSIQFGSDYHSSSGSYDVFVALLDTAGNWLWSETVGASSSDYAHGVALAESGNVYVTGYWSSGTLNFGSAGSITCGSCYSDGFLASLDSQGNWRWVERIGGSYYERGRSVAVDSQERVYVTGEFSYNVEFSGMTLNNGNRGYDYWGFIAQYSSSGSHSWAEEFGYSSYETYPEGISVDSGGNATVCGRFYAYSEFSGNRLQSNQNSWDMFVAQISPTGNWNWYDKGGGSSTDYCYEVSTEWDSGEIAITGYYYNTAVFGAYGLSSTGSNDVFAATLSSSGTWNWVKGYGSTSGDLGYGAAILGNETYFGFNYPTSLTIDGSSVSHSGSNDFVLVVHGIDSDGDKVGDRTDKFPIDSTQWSDFDGDGFGDNWGEPSWNASRFGGLGVYRDGATTPDFCPVAYGLSTRDVFGCPDEDGDGQSDSNDAFLGNSTQWQDTDSDGFGDNTEGEAPDDCPNVWGTSTKDSYGCTDLDGDGWSDLSDDFFNKPSQWNDTDGDGMGDNWRVSSWNSSRMSHWPGMWIEGAYLPDPSPLDRDNDGYEDIELDNSLGPFDDCPDTPGTSFRDRIGCVDSDGDGWSDISDAMPDNPNQYADSDGDGFGDSPGFPDSDDCPTRQGTSSIDQIGCPDNDGDGISNDADDCPVDFGQSSNGCPDTDEDGIPDVAESGLIDDCPTEWGTSTEDRIACPDRDGDGWSDGGDTFPSDPSQWVDSDADGLGDNPNGTDPDSCPAEYGESTENGLVGCLDSDGDGFADIIDGNSSVPGGWANDASLWSDTDGDGWADQQGFEQSDDCPLVAGNSTRFTKGCPDFDGDGWADMVDPDDDNDGFTTFDEINVGTDPFDPNDVPIDEDGDNTPDQLQQSSTLDPAVQTGVSIGILVIISIGALMSILVWRSSTSRKSNFERLRNSIDNAEGYEGILEVEKEVETLSEKGRIDAGQTALLFDRIGDKRYRLEEEMRVAQQAEWWAHQQAQGQQNHQQVDPNAYSQQGWGQQGWNQQ